MAGGHDDRDLSRDPFQDHAGDRVAFGVGQRESGAVQNPFSFQNSKTASAL